MKQIHHKHGDLYPNNGDESTHYIVHMGKLKGVRFGKGSCINHKKTLWSYWIEDVAGNVLYACHSFGTLEAAVDTAAKDTELETTSETVVHVVAWHYETGSGFNWYFNADAADEAFDEEKDNTIDHKAEGWSAYRFDFTAKVRQIYTDGIHDADAWPNAAKNEITRQIENDLDELCATAVEKVENILPTYDKTLTENYAESLAPMLAEKFVQAGYGNAGIEDADLAVLGIEKPKAGDWEDFCAAIYKSLTGEEIGNCGMRGRGFRSQWYGKQVSEAIKGKYQLIPA